MTPTADNSFDTVEFTMAYEGGELAKDEVVSGFQELINSGLAWKLEGQYGRMATQLIEQGLCTRPVAVKPAPGTSSTVAPFEGVTRDQIRQVGNEEYRILLYAAYNAMGLVGHESNGIAVLSEERNNVVCDELGCEASGYYGPSTSQQEIFDKLIACSDDEFRDIVNKSPRNRYAI